jgi:hypothetical protein
MNEYDDILNRIVEEFYDTGRLVLSETILGGPAIEVNNKIAMGDQLLSDSDFDQAIVYYNTALTLFNELEDGMKIFLKPSNINVEFIENKIIDGERKLWDSDYEKAKIIVPKYAIDLYSKMLGYYETLNDKVKKEKEEEKKEVEENKKNLELIIRGKEISDIIVKKRKEVKERQREIEIQNQEPLPLLSRETEIGDNDMFLRNLQNILIQYQNQRLDVEENEDEMRKLIDLEKERDESFYGDTTEELVRDYQRENALNETGEVDEETWESILSMEKRLERYSNRISKFSEDKKNVVSPEEYEELIKQGEDVSMLKKLLSQNLGNFLYHIQDKDIYVHTSFKKKDYEEKYEEDKKLYKSSPTDVSGIVIYPNLDAKYKITIDKIEKEIEKLENSPISKNKPTYNEIVQQYKIDLSTLDGIEKIPKKLFRMWEVIWKKIYGEKDKKGLQEKIVDLEKDKEEDIQKAKEFNDKYVKDTPNEDWLKRKKDEYVEDKQNASRQSSTIVGLFRKLFNAVEEVELVGETPLKDINNAISEINKTLKYEFKGNISDSRKTNIKKAIKNVIEAIKEGNVDNETIEKILELKTLAWGEYENGFIGGKGQFFDKGENRDIEGRIHNLPDKYLSDEIKSDRDSNEIKDDIKDNITNYLNDYKDDSGESVERDIVKHDLKMKGGKEIRDSENIVVLPLNSKVEVKSQSYTIDSYYSEPLASPMKTTTSEIRKDINLRNKYNEIIDGLYNWVNNTPEGISYGETLISRMVSGTSGILFSDDIYVPIEEIEFYISNKGQNNCDNHRRLTIRYRVKRNKNINIYKLKKNDITNNWEFERSETEIVRTGDKLKLKYCGGEDNTPNVKYNMGDNTLDEIIENFFDTGKFVI